MWWEVKVHVVNTFHFEPGWEIEMVSGNFAASQNMHLWLGVDGWSIGEAIYGDSLV
jgi:hypothetical protein